VVGVLLATTAYVVAEEISLTTYYPSPKGAYQTLSSTSTSHFATYEGGVGIGTPSPNPATKLEVKGLGATNATAGLNVTNSDGTSGFFVRDDGNVGIGTADPRNALHVSYSDATAFNPAAGFGASGLRVTNEVGGGAAGAGRGAGITLANTGSDSRGVLGLVTNAAAFGDLVFKTYNGGGSYVDAMTITSPGNVGIGTASPGEKLSVGGNVLIASGGKYMWNPLPSQNNWPFLTTVAGGTCPTNNVRVAYNGANDVSLCFGY